MGTKTFKPKEAKVTDETDHISGQVLQKFYLNNTYLCSVFVWSIKRHME